MAHFHHAPLASALVAVALLLTPVELHANCENTQATPALTRVSGGWGLDDRNSRFQPSTAINASNVDRLELKWVYGFADDKPRSFPLVTEDTIVIGDSGKGLVALDRETGCRRWIFRHTGEIGSAISFERTDHGATVFFADRSQGIFAIDAVDGKLLWHRAPGDNPVPLYSGSPLVHNETLYVPLSSLEIGLSINPFYGCCTTSGGLAALSTTTGDTNWHLRTVPQARVTGRHFLFVEEHGPSGAPVWGSPTLDEERGLVYFGTGQNYSRPATETSDAIFAVDIIDGNTRWVHQFTADDAYNMSCSLGIRHVNCPDPIGPDIDFGAPPLLAPAGGRDMLFAGQKSGDVYALDPDDGSVIWTARLGRGGALGGIHWGLAINPRLDLLFVPISDIDVDSLTGPGEPNAGVHALDSATGTRRWSHQREPRCADRQCWSGASAAITATSDLVFTGSLDGNIEALDAKTGTALWHHDSWRDYDTINDVAAYGGSFDAHGPMIVDNLLIVSSGYGVFDQRPGNAFLVFELPPKAAQ